MFYKYVEFEIIVYDNSDENIYVFFFLLVIMYMVNICSDIDFYYLIMVIFKIGDNIIWILRWRNGGLKSLNMLWLGKECCMLLRSLY